MHIANPIYDVVFKFMLEEATGGNTEAKMTFRLTQFSVHNS
jgi:hypothetical protein